MQMATTENERRTRRERVDPRVRRAGWTSIVPFLPPLDTSRLKATAVEEYETANGPANYALCSGGHILGVVEAKKSDGGDEGGSEGHAGPPRLPAAEPGDCAAEEVRPCPSAR